MAIWHNLTTSMNNVGKLNKSSFVNLMALIDNVHLELELDKLHRNHICLEQVMYTHNIFQGSPYTCTINADKQTDWCNEQSCSLQVIT